jgi:D-alanine-D-alanine ligase
MNQPPLTSDVEATRAQLKTKTIGVLMGGLSGEREVSFRSGRNCLRALQARGYNAIGIDALRDVAQRLEEEEVEVAFLALHGRFGEDGTIQGLLEMMGIPYTGSGVLASALGMNKIAAKKVVRGSGVPTPDYLEIGPHDDLDGACDRVEAELGLPVMLKPVEEGSSLGVAKCHDRAQFRSAVEKGRDAFGAVFVEKFVTGTEITVGVLEQFAGSTNSSAICATEDAVSCRPAGPGGRGFLVQRALIALPILEVVPHNEFYDYEAKYTEGMTDFVLPARLAPDVYAEAELLAVAAFKAVGCRGYARVDMMVDAAGTPWFVEVNTLPGMTDTSDLPAQALAAGISYDDLVETILLTAVS